MTGEVKRYYWLKLKEDFFTSKEIKQLRKLAGGDTFTIIYLKMLLRSIAEDGKLYFEGIEENFPAEVALDIDEEVENVKMTIAFLMAKGILVQCNEAEWEVLTAKELTGSECESARRVRMLRQRKKTLALQCDGQALQSNSDVTECNTEIDIEKDKRDKSKSKRKTFIPPTLDEVKEYADSIGFKLDAQYFFDYYEAADWKRSDGKPVVSWKQTMLTWKRKDEEKHPEKYQPVEEKKEEPFDWRKLPYHELERLQDLQSQKDREMERLGLLK